MAGLPRSLVNFRGPLLEALCDRGHEVMAAAPDLCRDTATCERLGQLGVAVHDVAFQRAGIDPAGDMAALSRLYRLMRRVRPDIVLAYTIKPVVYGMLAARLARVPHRFALVTGLGYAFVERKGAAARMVEQCASALYRVALRGVSLVFFMNPDDQALFRERRLISPSTRSMVVNGSGVDVAHFAPASLPGGPVRFLLIARLLGDKGVREYAKAATRLKAEQFAGGFDLVGDLDANPDSVGRGEVERWNETGSVRWHGPLDDVRPAIAKCHVYVLPSYREGTPRTVLEAMAMGRPIITTDVPGCRETVIEGVNGFLVPPRDSKVLAAAMRRFIDDPSLIPAMGAESRRIAEEKYDVHKVNKVMLDAMGL